MSNFLQVAVEAAKKAEKVILRYYKSDFQVSYKIDRSPVTAADIESEKIITQTIKMAFPHHGFLGEESGGNRHSRGYLWVIDPIDGTKNFVRHIPLFAIQLALLKDNEIVVGVSNAPILKELIYAEKGRGAFLNGQRIRVNSGISSLDRAYLSFGGLKYFEKHSLTKNLLAIVNSTRAHRGFGDAWSYHLLAQGKIDIVIEAETKIWDIAAASIIVEEAGGKVTDIQGKPVDINTISLVATNGKLHEEVTRRLQSV